jgi:hypothetical protein
MKNLKLWCRVRAFRLRIKETRRVQRTDLKAEKNSVSWKTGFSGCYPNICWIVTGDVLCVSADDYCNNKRLLVNCVSRNDQYGSISSLFSTFNGVEIDKVDVAAANHSSIHRSPSGGILLRLPCIRP